MTFDLPTLIAIRQRMDRLNTPLLFHDVRTPQKQAARVARVMRWIGRRIEMADSIETSA